MSELAGLKLLRRIEEGVAGKSGEAFFRQIVCDIAGALNAHAAFTSRLLPGRRAMMQAFWVDGRYERCLEYALDGTPCEFVYNGRITGFARDIGTIFPADREWFAELGVNSYLGIPIMDEKGEVFGHLAVMDKPERDWHEAEVDVLRLFSLRAAVELERDRAHRQLAESNESLRLMNEQLRHEVAQRLAMEQQLAAAKSAAESANQAKSTFISQMSHELRTPLNGILGYAQLLRRKTAPLTEEQRDGLSIIERSGEHLLTLVNDLLDLAKIEAGKLELHSDLVDLYALLQHVTDLIQVRADRAAQHFNAQLASSVPSLVRGDARALRQVLLNLLGNAVKFTDTGGRVELRVRGNELDADHVRVRFEICDSGIGMSHDQLARIFEPFHRIEDPIRRTEGTGLGLAITRRLVEAMNGRIDVRSVPQRGTTFIVELDMPLAAVDTRPSEHDRQIVGYQGPVRRILIVDDDDVNRALVANLLTSIGFETCTAHDGAQALSMIERSKPDLVITDLVMLQMDGVQLARAVRTSSDSMNLPVLAHSANASDCIGEEALAAGCTAFLPKPVRLAALLDSIGKLLQLEWRFDSDIASEPTASQSSAAFVLEHAHADELYHLALLGDIATLKDRARDLLEGNTDAQHFYAELTMLANQYDTRAIRRLLDNYRVGAALDASGH